MVYWLVVSTPLKNISQLRLLFPIYGKKMFQTTNQFINWGWYSPSHDLRSFFMVASQFNNRLGFINPGLPWMCHEVNSSPKKGHDHRKIRPSGPSCWEITMETLWDISHEL